MARNQHWTPERFLIGCLPFGDFLQVGFIAVLGLPIMGALGAGPREFSSVAVAYAGVAVAAIALQGRVVDWVGWRIFLLASAALSVAGVLVCLAAGTLGWFAIGRMLMAAGSAPSLTASRVLVNELLPGPARFRGIRFLAIGVSWGVACGPLLAALALDEGSWQWGVAGLALPPTVVAGLALATLDGQAGRRRGMTAADGMTALLFAAGSLPLMWALQQANFDFFDEPGWLLAGACGSVGILAIPLVLEWRRRDGAALALRQMAGDRRLHAGLLAFGLCYLVVGGGNMVFPTLLQRALDLPLDVVASWIGFGSLGGVVAWMLLSRMLPAWPGPVRYYVAGLAALALAGWQAAGLSETAEPARVLPALVLHGAFVIILLSVTAMQAFRSVQAHRDLLLHANQLKNMFAQLAVAAGTVGATLLLQSRSALHYTRLLEGASARPDGLPAAIAALAASLPPGANGSAPLPEATALLAQMVGREALFMATLDYFRVLACVATACILLAMAFACRRWHASRCAPLVA